MRNTTKKKSPEAIKQELLASIMEIVDEEDYARLNEYVKDTKSFSKEKIEKS